MESYMFNIGDREIHNLRPIQTGAWRSSVENYLGLASIPSDDRQARLDLFARTFGYRDYKSLEPALSRYRNVDDFISRNIDRVTLPYDHFIRSDAPVSLQQADEGRRASRREFDRCLSNEAVDHGAVIEGHARSSRGRIDSIARTRAELENARRSLREKGNPQSDERLKRIDELIERCDGQIIEEAEFLMGMTIRAKERGLVLPGQLKDSLLLIRDYANNYGLVEFSEELKAFLEEHGLVGSIINKALLFFHPSTKQNEIGDWRLRNDLKFVSPYAYWLDSKQQEKEIEEWKEMVQAIYKKNDEFKVMIRQYNWKLDLARMAARLEPEDKLSAAVIHMQKPTEGGR